MTDMSAEPLSRYRIVRTSIDLIEREGVDAVSMRRIAAELDVGVMSLYNHVPSKAALLDDVASTVMSEVEYTDDPEADWTERVRAQARTFWQLAERYPRCTMLVVSRQTGSPTGLLPMERSLATLRGAGFDGPDAVRVMRMCVAYIVGSMVREVGISEAAAARDRRAGQATFPDPALFPNVIELAPLLLEYDREAEFEFGLDLLIRGIAALPRRAATGGAPG